MGLRFGSGLGWVWGWAMGLGWELSYLVNEAVDERRESDHVELQVRRLELDLLEGLQRLEGQHATRLED